MKIFVSNDDGYQSEGLKLLVEYLGKNNEVFVVVPDCQKSGFSHSMTFRRPMFCNKIDIKGAKEAYALSGSPADCVRFGIEFFCFKPDAVISGPNIGPNLTFDVHYSGTVGAAREAAVLGFKSIALSCAVPHNEGATAHFDATCRYITENLDKFMSIDLKGSFFNVNVPNVPFAQIKGTKIVPYGRRFFEDVYEKYVSPEDGRTGYCLAGDFAAFDEHEETDAYYIGQNYVTVTPLLSDICDYKALNDLKGKF